MKGQKEDNEDSWSCYVEFSAGGESEVYEITEDGNLMALNTTGDDLS